MEGGTEAEEVRGPDTVVVRLVVLEVERLGVMEGGTEAVFERLPDTVDVREGGTDAEEESSPETVDVRDVVLEGLILEVIEGIIDTVVERLPVSVDVKEEDTEVEPLDNTDIVQLGGTEPDEERLLETVVENDTIEEPEGDTTPVVDSLTDTDINPEILNEADTVFVPDEVAVRNPDPDTVAETVSVPDPEIESLVETDCDDAPVRLEVNVGDTLLLPDFVGIADADTDAEAEILEEVLGKVDSVELAADDSVACDSVAELERTSDPE